MHDVFISYSHNDVQIADAICHNFEAEGIRCWYAPRNINPGEEWADAIIKALEETKVMVLVFTDYSNVSVQVQREVDTALKFGKTVIPFKCSETEPTGGMKYYLSTLHWLDAMNDTLEKSILNLRSHVQNLLYGDGSVYETYAAPSAAAAGIAAFGQKKSRTVLYIIIGVLAAAVIAAVLLTTLGRNKKEETAESAKVQTAQSTDAQSQVDETDNEQNQESQPAEPKDIQDQTSQTDDKSAGANETPIESEDTTEAGESKETADENTKETSETGTSSEEESSAVLDPNKDSPGAENYLYSTIKSNGQLGISLDVYFGEEVSEIVVPEVVDGLPVIKIGEKCFENCQYIEKVVLPETITYIDYRAFYGCKQLSEINFPESLSGWGGWVFAFTNFTDIVVPDGFNDLGYGSFFGCENLQTVVLSDKVTQIGQDTFRGVSSLQSVTIPSPEIEIESKAFEKGDDVTIIGVKGSFAEKYAKGMGLLFEAYGLDPGTADEDTEDILADGFGYFYSKIIWSGQEGIRLDVYYGEKTPVIEIPGVVDGLPVIVLGEELFRGCDYIEKVVLPKTLIHISNMVFYECTNLSEINFPDALTGCSSSAFAHTALTEVVFPSKFEDLGSGMFYGCNNLKTVVLTEKVKQIGVDTFRSGSALESVTIPSADIEIATKAFTQNADVTIIGVKDSFAEKYAKAMGLSFEEYKP